MQFQNPFINIVISSLTLLIALTMAIIAWIAAKSAKRSAENAKKVAEVIERTYDATSIVKFLKYYSKHEGILKTDKVIEEFLIQSRGYDPIDEPKLRGLISRIQSF